MTEILPDRKKNRFVPNSIRGKVRSMKPYNQLHNDYLYIYIRVFICLADAKEH